MAIAPISARIGSYPAVSGARLPCLPGTADISAISGRIVSRGTFGQSGIADFVIETPKPGVVRPNVTSTAACSGRPALALAMGNARSAILEDNAPAKAGPEQELCTRR